MTTPITPMSAHRIANSFNDRFDLLHKEDDIKWLRTALASHLAYVKEKIQPKKLPLIGVSEMQIGNEVGLNSACYILQSEIDELTK